MNKQEIKNRVFDKLEDPFGNENPDVYPYSIIPVLLDEIIDWLSLNQTWNWARTQSTLLYEKGNRKFNLDEYDIYPTKIKSVYFYEGNSLTLLRRIDKEKMRENYYFDKIHRPTQFAIRNNILILDYVPDKDYNIIVDYYKLIDLPITNTDEIDILPERHQKVIPDYIAACLS